MGKLNYLNYSALAVLLILTITVLVRGMLNGKRNRYFFYVIVVALLSVIFDIAAVGLDNSGSGNVVAKYMAHSGYLILHNFSTPVFITYLINLTGTEYQIRTNRFQMALLAVPFFVVLVFTLTSPLTDWVYFLDANDTYTRGPLFILLYISAIIYMVYGAIYLFRYRKMFERWQFISAIWIFLGMPVAVLIQFFKPNLPVEMFSQALGALFIMLVIQRPEERLDSVTGFNKYDAYTADMKQVFYNEMPIHIIMIQITNYKWLSDLLGFTDTNELQKVVAVRIRETCMKWAPATECYHFGRGMFALTLDPSSLSRSETLVEKLHEALAENFCLQRMDIHVSAQLCVIHYPEDIKDFQVLLSFGNEFEWQKNVGSVLYAKDIIQEGHYEMMHHLDAIIEDAFVNNRFSVYYQPIYSVKKGRFNSAEALLRLKDEEYGFISPDIFIPVAERNGAIHKVGAYVLEEVCKFISSDEFKRLGLDYIEVNLSTVQCMRSDLVTEVKDILERYNVSPKMINLEITETAAAHAQNIMLENINELAKEGIAISLDDFGTGYSNMQRVASLPLQFVKLDKTFTKLEGNPKLEIVVRNAIRMIKDMNLQIVAEGIETLEMVHQFSEFDCEYIQGYYYSKPLPKADFVDFVQQKKEEEWSEGQEERRKMDRRQVERRQAERRQTNRRQKDKVTEETGEETGEK